MHPGYLGQWQESHRDQGHSTLGISLAGALCEMAWNQGEDLYGYWNNRLLAGAEYVAKTNLADASGNALFTMPFAPYTGVFGTGTQAAGTGSLRPCWELIYNHYVNRKGLSAPWTKAIVDKVRPERADGGDQPGLGTLLYARDPVPAAKPSGLSALLNDGKVQLSWWGSAGGAVSALGDFTIAVWVYWDATAVNTRIFDFGSNGKDQLRFSASRNQFWNEESVSASVLPSGRWVHVAFTLSGTVGTLYMDGAQVATADGIWINPFQLGRTTQTWLGRSPYGGDPFFKGRMQDFRIYGGAKDAAFIADLAR